MSVQVHVLPSHIKPEQWRTVHYIPGYFLQARLFIMSTGNSIVTPRQLRYIAETIEVLFAVQGFTLSFHSLLEIQKACVAAEDFNNRQPVIFPNHLYDIITSPTPDTGLHLKSFAVWNNRANLQAMQMRVPARSFSATKCSPDTSWRIIALY